MTYLIWAVVRVTSSLKPTALGTWQEFNKQCLLLRFWVMPFTFSFTVMLSMPLILAVVGARHSLGIALPSAELWASLDHFIPGEFLMNNIEPGF